MADEDRNQDETSARDSLAAALAEAESADPGDGGEAAGGTTEATGDDLGAEAAAFTDDAGAEAAEAAAESAATGRARDEKGRFAPKAKDGEEAAAAAAPDKGEDGKEGKTPADSADDLEPPADWSLEDQKMFRAQTPEARKWLLETHQKFKTDHTAKTSEAAQARQQYEPIEQLLGPRRQANQMLGFKDDAHFLGHLLALSDFAKQKPADFVRWFTEQHRLDAQSLFPSAAPAATGADDDEFPPDPAVQKAIERAERAEAEAKRVAEMFEGRQQSEQESLKQRHTAEMDRIITQFQSATDESGNPKYPYFNEVKKHMGHLLPTVEDATSTEQAMETAYHAACRAHPGVSAKIAEADKAKAERARIREQQKKAAEAQRAGSSVTGTPAGPTTPAPHDNARDEFRAVFQEAGGVL